MKRPKVNILMLFEQSVEKQDVGVRVTEGADVGREEIVGRQNEDPDMAEGMFSAETSVDAVLTVRGVDCELNRGGEMGLGPFFAGCSSLEGHRLAALGQLREERFQGAGVFGGEDDCGRVAVGR